MSYRPMEKTYRTEDKLKNKLLSFLKAAEKIRFPLNLADQQMEISNYRIT